MRCKWFRLCPLRRFEKSGQLDFFWRRQYCERHFSDCLRYQMEERGEAHPDTLLPNGEMMTDKIFSRPGSGQATPV
jgi:hypothetical protein